MRQALMLNIWLVAVLAVAAAGVVCAAEQQGEGGIAPAVDPPADATVITQSHADFATYPLINQRIAQRGGIEGNIGSTRTVEGALARRTYRVTGDATVQSVTTAYARRLAQAGFDTLYQCDGADCGPTFVRASPGYRADSDLFDVDSDAQRYRAARRSDGSGDVYVGLQVAATNDGVVVQFDTLRVKARQVNAISVNAAQMAQDLENEGRVALYGIFFDFDSAQLKAGSQPTLREIAKLMAQKPDLRLLVVGHTDSHGPFDYNLDLSQRRAKAVVDVLVNDYGIDSGRLKPFGVGYAAPTASNNSEIGQAKNRRVELVPW